MSGDTIGPDGLTDVETQWRNSVTAGSIQVTALDRLAAERLAHAAEKAAHAALMVERDRLRSALEEMVCATEDSDNRAAYRALTAARALLGEVKP